MNLYEKAPEVDEDLRAIISYTAERWGANQVRKYMLGLESHLELMAVGMAHTRSLDHVLEGLKVARYERHFVFGIERVGEPLLILAVFHEKMSVIERLKKRL
jgi:plasmid stabilization system protein ParE